MLTKESQIAIASSIPNFHHRYIVACALDLLVVRYEEDPVRTQRAYGTHLQELIQEINDDNQRIDGTSDHRS